MNKKFYYSLGRPFSPFYSMVMRIRERCYQKGIFRSFKFEAPVISIGNLTMGGTGKTPMVQHLASFLLNQGFQPAIISRGYGGATKERVNIVSDGKEVLLEASYVGDEPRMLAETLPGVLVLTGVVRRLPAARAVEMGADILLLDDGFQHMAIQRDLDLVLFNADTLAGNSRVFPGGDLREPVKGLRRCDAFIMTGINEQNREKAARFGLLLQDRFPGKSVFYSKYSAARLLEQKKGVGGSKVDWEVLDNHRCFAFCGIARPESFRQTLEGLEIEPVGFQELGDHHEYHPKIMRHLVSQAEQKSATCLLCTEKDLVKLADVDLGIPLYAISMKVEPDNGLNDFILKHIAA